MAPRPHATIRSAKVRTTIVAVVVVGIAVVASGLLLVTEMRRALVGDLEERAQLRAQVMASTLEAGTRPSEVRLGHEDDTFIQIVDRNNQVLAASPSIHGAAAVVEKIDGDSVIIPGESLEDPEEDFMVVERSARTDSGAMRVIVGRSLDVVTESTSLAARLLAVTGPMLVLIAGGMAWVLAGRALAPVERSQRDREMFVADASHELRNPIASIIQQTEVALAHPDRTSIPELAHEVLEEGRRLERITEDLLLLARADEDALRSNFSEVDVDDLMLEEVRRLNSRSSDLRVDASGVGAARIRGDREAISRVLRNLIENAERHAATTVRVGIRETAVDVIIDIDDDGDGVAPHDRRDIFERFTRLDEARDRGRGGTGLGLAIVAAVVAAHGGSVDVGEAPIGGAHFEVMLPKAGV